ncbi:MAG: NAD(P)/FAD-dependent oxidoreductase [Candidatus Hadarchaeales archaeon]
MIVGGGPAGLMAARVLAEEGIPPLVLEKNSGFGQKVCSEVMRETRYGFPVLPLLGRGVVERKFEEVELVFHGKTFRLPFWKSHPLRKWIREPSPLLLMNRERMERNLAKKASAYGAVIQLGKVVKRVERMEEGLLLNGEIEAKLVIGADGALSLMRKFVGERLRNLGYGINIRVKRRGEEGLKVFVGSEVIPLGDAWRFAGGRKENAGIWTAEARYAGILEEKWEAFRRKENLPSLRPRLIPLPSSPPCRTYFPHLLLAGDAGGLNDPLTGAGIYAALLTGYLAGLVAAEAVRKRSFEASFLRRYEMLWRNFMGEEIRRALLLKRLHPFLMRKELVGFLPLLGAVRGEKK